MIYCTLNRGILFTGDAAMGTNYEKDKPKFAPSPVDMRRSKGHKDEELCDVWRAIKRPLWHILPLHGILIWMKRRLKIMKAYSSGAAIYEPLTYISHLEDLW